MHNMKVNQVSCGWNHSLILATNNQLFGIGANNHGQLGQSLATKKVVYHQPIQIKLDCNVKQIHCGFRNSFLITDGRILATGYNRNGETINKGNKIIYEFESDQNLEKQKVKLIRTGHKFSVYLLEDGKLVGSGNNRFGQLGSQYKGGVELVAQNVDYVDCNWNSILIVIKDSLQMTGRNDMGQLGTAHSQQSQGFITLPITTSDVKVQCGSEHTLLYCDDKVYSWGWNEHGNLGTDDKCNRFQPYQIQVNQKVKDIYASAAVSYIILQ